MDLRRKRVYDAPSPEDGARVLVDRLWPRGVKKETARLDAWLREVAPSHELRKWLHADASRWDDFQQRYRAELRDNPAVEQLLTMLTRGRVTLLYGARDPDRNHALVLEDVLRERAHEA